MYASFNLSAEERGELPFYTIRVYVAAELVTRIAEGYLHERGKAYEIQHAAPAEEYLDARRIGCSFRHLKDGRKVVVIKPWRGD